jgi:DNA-binding GntR family transcriptional regulator
MGHQKSDDLGFLSVNLPMGIRETIINVLRRAIITGQLKPGQAITERQLSLTFSISTTPVKEALRILETEGLVQTFPRKGTIVSEFVSLKLSEIYKIRSVLEGASAYMAAQNATEEEMKNIYSLWDGTSKLLETDNPQTLIENNTLLHKMIREASHNFYLQHLIKGVLSYDLIFRQLNLSSKEERILGWEEHGAVVRSLVKREAEHAERLLQQHIIRSGDRIINILNHNLKSNTTTKPKEINDLLLTQGIEVLKLNGLFSEE